MKQNNMSQKQQEKRKQGKETTETDLYSFQI